jgi:hypothetical protein
MMDRGQYSILDGVLSPGLPTLACIFSIPTYRLRQESKDNQNQNAAMHIENLLRNSASHRPREHLRSMRYPLASSHRHRNALEGRLRSSYSRGWKGWLRKGHLAAPAGFVAPRVQIDCVGVKQIRAIARDEIDLGCCFRFRRCCLCGITFLRTLNTAAFGPSLT